MREIILSTNQEWNNAWERNWDHPGLRQVKIAVAYCSSPGVDKIRREHFRHNVPVQLLVGLNDGVTDVFAQEKLVNWVEAERNVEVRGQFQPRGRFHPKMYIFEHDHEVKVLLGSVNLTYSAFHENTEAALEHDLSPDQSAGLLQVFRDWWQQASVLERPGSLALELAHLNIEERLIATMKLGMMVDIETTLAAARGHFNGDVFNLGESKNIREGVLFVDSLAQSQVLLLGSKTYTKLIGRREAAHRNSRQLSYRCAAGNFLPGSAFKVWKERHSEIEAQFTNLVKQFDTEAGRAEELRELMRGLPEQVMKVWREIHRNSDLPSENLTSIQRQTEQQFQKSAPSYSKSLRLTLSLSPHALPGMLGYAKSSSIVETELHRHAVSEKEYTLRDFMTTLLVTTRELISDNLGQIIGSKLAPAVQKRIREQLKGRLLLLNFHGDGFCSEVAHEVTSLQRDRDSLRRLLVRASSDLTAVQDWPQMTFDEVLHDFASRVGWVSPEAR